MNLIAQVTPNNWDDLLIFFGCWYVLSEFCHTYRTLFVSTRDYALVTSILEVCVLVSGTSFLGTLFYVDVALAAHIFGWTMSQDVLMVVLLIVITAYALWGVLSELYATFCELRKLQMRDRRR